MIVRVIIFFRFNQRVGDFLFRHVLPFGKRHSAGAAVFADEFFKFPDNKFGALLGRRIAPFVGRQITCHTLGCGNLLVRIQIAIFNGHVDPPPVSGKCAY